MTYALRLPMDVAANIQEFASWTLWQSREAARKGTPSCQAMLGGFPTMADRADDGRRQLEEMDDIEIKPLRFFCWQSDLLGVHAEPGIIMFAGWGGLPFWKGSEYEQGGRQERLQQMFWECEPRRH